MSCCYCGHANSEPQSKGDPCSRKERKDDRPEMGGHSGENFAIMTVYTSAQTGAMRFLDKISGLSGLSGSTPIDAGQSPRYVSGRPAPESPNHSPGIAPGEIAGRRPKENPDVTHCHVGAYDVEDRGLEPLTFWLPARRSPN